MGHAGLIGQWPVSRPGHHQTMQRSASTQLLKEIAWRFDQQAERPQRLPACEDPAIPRQKYMRVELDSISDERAILSWHLPQDAQKAGVALQRPRRTRCRSRVVGFECHKPKRSREVLQRVRTLGPPLAAELAFGVNQNPRQDAEAYVPDHPDGKEQLKRLKFLAVLTELADQRLALPQRTAMLEVVDQQIRVPNDVERPVAATATEKVRATAIVEAGPNGRERHLRRLDRFSKLPRGPIQQTDAVSLKLGIAMREERDGHLLRMTSAW